MPFRWVVLAAAACLSTAWVPALAETTASQGVPWVVDLDAGAGHTCALLADGNARCWGRNNWGQAGSYGGGDAVQVSAGAGFSCALQRGGDVLCWGRQQGAWHQHRTFGEGLRPEPARQVALGSYTAWNGWMGGFVCVLLSALVRCWDVAGQAYDLPNSQEAVQLDAGVNHVCWLSSDGSVRCWGILGGTAWHGSRVPLPGAATQVSAGSWHACARLTTGAVACWGSDAWGNTQGDSAPTTVAVAAGGAHTCALGVDGNVRCWGHPWLVQGYGGGDAVRLSTGEDHACVLARTGRVHCWGGNGDGQATPPPEFAAT